MGGRISWALRAVDALRDTFATTANREWTFTNPAGCIYCTTTPHHWNGFTWEGARCRFRKIAVNYVWTSDKCSLRPDMPVIWRLHSFCLTMCLVTQNRWYSLNLQSETRSGFRSRSIILKLRFGICQALEGVSGSSRGWQEEDSQKAPISAKPGACRGLSHGL